MSYGIRCPVCRAELEDEVQTHCAAGHLHPEIYYKYPAAHAAELLREQSPVGIGMWQYKPLLPVLPDTEPVSLGEGGTPLIRAKRLADHLGTDALYIKLEGANPTGTFKDRCASVAISKAAEQGYSDIAIASAGNAGAAASAYAARAGLTCWVFVPQDTPRERIVQSVIVGARVVAVEGSVNDCSDLVDVGVAEFGWYPATTATPKNLYQGEGARTIAFEMWQQLNYEVPDWIIAPVGGGGLLSAIARGWRELRDYQLVTRVPRLVAVQPTGCAPLVRAVMADTPPDAIEPWGEPTSVVSSVADPFPMDGSRAMSALKLHGGHAVAVHDDAIVEAEARLARHEGIFVEPASAMTLAALDRLLQDGLVAPDERVVLVATGVGFKDLDTASSLAEVEVPTIEANAEQMLRLFGR